jgi:predicted small secreted protein
MKHSLPFGALVALIALALSACSGSAAGGGEDQQAEGRPLPKFEQASLPAGRYHTTEFEPSLSFRITGGEWVFECPSGALGDPERPDYLFLAKDPWGQIAFFNLRKVKGIYKPMGPRGATEPVPAPDELVDWFQQNPYLKTSEPEPATVGGVKGVQFDAVLPRSRPVNHKGICGGTGCLDIFKLSTGGSSELFGFYREHEKREHYIILKDVKRVPVVIIYNDETDVYDEFVPVAEKVLDSVRWADD